MGVFGITIFRAGTRKAPACIGGGFGSTLLLPLESIGVEGSPGLEFLRERQVVVLEPIPDSLRRLAESVVQYEWQAVRVLIITDCTRNMGGFGRCDSELIHHDNTPRLGQATGTSTGSTNKRGGMHRPPRPLQTFPRRATPCPTTNRIIPQCVVEYNPQLSNSPNYGTPTHIPPI